MFWPCLTYLLSKSDTPARALCRDTPGWVWSQTFLPAKTPNFPAKSGQSGVVAISPRGNQDECKLFCSLVVQRQRQGANICAKSSHTINKLDDFLLIHFTLIYHAELILKYYPRFSNRYQFGLIDMHMSKSESGGKLLEHGKYIVRALLITGSKV